MNITLDLSDHQLEILQQFRVLLQQQRETPASASTLKHQRINSGLNTCAQILAEAVDKAASTQGV
jgi:hypothetical protein